MKNFKKLLLVSSAAAALAVVGAQEVNAQYWDGTKYVVEEGSEALFSGIHEVLYEERVTPHSYEEVENSNIEAGNSYVIQEGIDGSEGTYYVYDVLNGNIEDSWSEERIIVAETPQITEVGTGVTQGDNPEGREDVIQEETVERPDVVDSTAGTENHVLQQNDKIIRGSVVPGTASEVQVRKNGEIIGTATIDARGYYTIHLEEALEYGNTIEFYYYNGSEHVFSDQQDVDYVAVEHTPAPIRVGAIWSETNIVNGKARPFDLVTLRVYDPSSQTYTDTQIQAYADAHGNFQFNLGSLATKGFEVHITTEDSSGNVSNVIEVVVDDTSDVDAAIVRRPSRGDKSVTIRTEPYAEVELTITDTDGTVIGFYTAFADGNGIARITTGFELPANAELSVRTKLDGRGFGSHKLLVREERDNVRPEVPTVEEVVEGSTILQGIAEPYALVSAMWIVDGDTDYSRIFTLADEKGNFLFDLFAYGITTPFTEGQSVYVQAHDNRNNNSDELVRVAPAGTPRNVNEEPIEVNPHDPQPTDPEVDGDKEDDKDKDPKPVKPGKPGEKDKADAATLPETGESSSYLVFGAAALSILAGLGLVAPKFKKED